MKFNNYKFWISLLAGIIVLISTLGTVFNFSVNEVAITSIGTAVLGIFVTLGLVKKEEKNQEKQNENNSEQTTENQANADNKIDVQSNQNQKIQNQANEDCLKKEKTDKSLLNENQIKQSQIGENQSLETVSKKERLIEIDEKQNNDINKLVQKQKTENQECFEQAFEQSKHIKSKLNALKNDNKNN